MASTRWDEESTEAAERLLSASRPLCEYVKNLPQPPLPNDFYRTLVRLLGSVVDPANQLRSLYHSAGERDANEGVALPTDSLHPLSEDESFDIHAVIRAVDAGRPKKLISYEYRRALLKQVQNVIDADAMELMDEEESDNPPAYYNPQGTLMFFDDLTDVVLELEERWLQWENASQEKRADIFWSLNFTYEIHWASHLYQALHTAHRLWERYEGPMSRPRGTN